MLLCILMDVPVARQGNRKLGAFKFMRGELRGHIHAVRAHPEGDEHIVAAFLGRLNDADVQMDVRRYDLMKDVPVCAEVCFDVILDGVHLFFGVEFRGHRSFLFICRVISANFFHRGIPYVC